jgi:SHS2 domain-containing protein
LSGEQKATYGHDSHGRRTVHPGDDDGERRPVARVDPQSTASSVPATMTRFDLRDHTADVAVEARATTLGGVLAAAADGLAAAQCERVPAGGSRFEVVVTAESREALLFDYLDALIYRRDVDGVLPVDNEAVVTGGVESVDRPADGYHLAGSARGVPLSTVDAREVKAVTYSEMRVDRLDDGWEVYVVLDV